MKRFFLLIPTLFLLISASAQEFITPGDGSMSFGGLQWSFHGFAPGWKLFPVTRAFSPGKAEIRWDRTTSALDLSFRLRHPSPRPVELLFGNLKIPLRECEKIVFDNTEFLLPERYSKRDLLTKTVRRIRLFLPGGVELSILSPGERKVHLLDARAFQQEHFSLRFECAPAKGKILSSGLDLRFEVSRAQCVPVDLTAAANSTFRDELEGDGCGWTDQGSGNDLRAFRETRLSLGAIFFDVIQPLKKENSCLVLAGKERGFGAEKITVRNLPQKPMRTLLLLHASAWPPKPGGAVGELEVVSRSGKRQRIPVRSGIDCGNWWSPFSTDNARVLWSAENSSASIGLYISAFPLEFDDPDSVTFRIGSASGAWMIAAVSLADRPVSLPVKREMPEIHRAGKEWIPLAFRRVTKAGSALDFTFLRDAPAGKYGAVRFSPEGHLTFERAPGKRLRLHGINLCFSANYLSREEADAFVEEVVRCGYNAVRFHHHDTLLSDPDSDESAVLNRENLDRLDYLFFRLKQNGIYMTTDLYTNRRFRAGDAIPERSPENDTMKQLIAVSPGAMENWKRFARAWMTHVNPYTGIAWGKDPALFSLCLVNENELTYDTPLYRKHFQAWCTDHPSLAGESPERRYRRFLNDLQRRTTQEQMRFLKEELNISPLLTDLNYRNKRNMALIREELDLVDNHEYFDHPTFPEKAWQHPFRHTQRSSIRLKAIVPRRIMATRLWGKPFLVTEYNFTFPNRNRTEGVPLMYGYAALQDWDGIFRFAWSHVRTYMVEPSRIRTFDAVNDPLARLSDRLAAALFLRGDVAPGQKRYAFDVSPEEAGSSAEFSADAQELGLVSQIGSFVRRGKSAPSGCTPAVPPSVQSECILSDTGELRLTPKAGTFAIVSPRTESLTLPCGALKGGVLELSGASCLQTVAAISLDGKPLARSSSILLLHLLETSNTGAKFDDSSRRIMRKTGELPLLLRRGSADVSLHTEVPLRIQALSCDGETLGEVKYSFQNGKLLFRISTDLYPGGVMAYHLTSTVTAPASPRKQP